MLNFHNVFPGLTEALQSKVVYETLIACSDERKTYLKNV